MPAFATSDRFAQLDPRDRDRLEALSKLDQFADGAEILRSGQPCEWLYLIASGAVEVRAPGPSGEQLLFALRPGDLLGEEESFAHLPPGVRHVARGETILRALPKSPLKMELRQHRQLASALLAVYCRSISEKVRAANEAAARAAPGGGASRPPPASRAGDAAPEELGPLGRPPHLSREEAGWLSVLGQTLSAAPGETVITEGDASRSFYVVESGRLEVRKQVGGEQRLLAELADRDLFGFMAFVDGKPRSASVVAVAPCTLTAVDAGALEKALHLNFTVSFKFLGTLCGVLGKTLRDTTARAMA